MDMTCLDFVFPIFYRSRFAFINTWLSGCHSCGTWLFPETQFSWWPWFLYLGLSDYVSMPTAYSLVLHAQTGIQDSEEAFYPAVQWDCAAASASESKLSITG
jgi:hypothetical protein